MKSLIKINYNIYHLVRQDTYYSSLFRHFILQYSSLHACIRFQEIYLKYIS